MNALVVVVAVVIVVVGGGVVGIVTIKLLSLFGYTVTTWINE